MDPSSPSPQPGLSPNGSEYASSLSTKSVPPNGVIGFQYPPPPSSSQHHHRLHKSIFDSESPFLKHMRVSLQIWLRVLVDDPILMTSSELSKFIQFRWLFSSKSRRPSPSKSEGQHHHILLHNNRRIVGGHHAPDNNANFEALKNGKIRHLSAPNFNALKGVYDHHSSDDTEFHRPALSDFTLLKVVGKGAFGKVLQVRRANDPKIYAMKILKKENVIKRNQIEHTKTERRVLGYVNHPFIVSLYFSFQTETKLFLVLDYCGGGGMLSVDK